MENDLIKIFIKNHNLKKSDNIFYGDLYGFMTTMTYDGQSICVNITAIFPNEKSVEFVENEIDKISDELLDNDILTLSVEESTLDTLSLELVDIDENTNIDDLEGIFERVYSCLKNAGAVGSEICYYCSDKISGNERTVMLVEKYAYAMHKKCVALRQKECEHEQREQVRKNKNAMAASAVGAVFSAFLWIFLWLDIKAGFALPIGSLFFISILYKLSGGRAYSNDDDGESSLDKLRRRLIISSVAGQILGLLAAAINAVREFNFEKAMQYILMPYGSNIIFALLITLLGVGSAYYLMWNMYRKEIIFSEKNNERELK